MPLEITNKPVISAPTDPSSVSPDDAAVKAITERTEKRIKQLDRNIIAAAKNLKSSDASSSSWFGVAKAEQDIINNDYTQMKALQAQKQELEKALKESKELKLSGKSTEASQTLETSLKEEKSKTKKEADRFQADAKKTGEALDESISRIETAEAITRTVKDGAVIAGATVATVMTAGTAGALLAIGAGTVSGTGIAILANGSEAASHIGHGTKTTEQAILDACEQTKQHATDSFKTSVTSMIGAGVAGKAVVKATAAKLSTTKIAATKAITQGSSSAVSSSSYDNATNYWQAHEDFSKQYASEIKNGNKEELTKLKDKFFRDKGLDASSMAKNIAIDTTAGALSSFVGSKIPGPADKAITKAGMSITRGAAIIAADVSSGTVIGLGTAVAKGEELDRTAILREITSNVTSSLQGTASAHVKPSTRLAEQRISAATRKIEVPTPINEFAPTAAKPRIDISHDPSLAASEAATVTRAGETRPSQTTIKLKTQTDLSHEITHSTQAGIDPGTKASGKTLMLENEYLARRSLQELEAKIFKPEEGKTYTPEELKANDLLKQTHSKLKQDINTAIKAIERKSPEEATKHYKAAADLAAMHLTAADLKQFQEDYQTNLNRKVGEAIQQKNFATKTLVIKPEEHEAIRVALTIEQRQPEKIRHQYDNLDRTIEMLLKRDGKSSEVARYRDFRDAVIDLDCSTRVNFTQNTPIDQLPTSIQELNSHQTALTNLIKRIENADNNVRKKTNNKITLEEADRSNKAGKYRDTLNNLKSKKDALNLEIARLSALGRPIHPEKRKVDDAIIATGIKAPALRAAATAVEARGNQDYDIPVKGKVNRGLWTIEVLQDTFTKNFNGLSMPEEGRYGKGDFSEKRIEVVLEKLKQAGTIAGYAMSGNDTFYDHMGVDAWVGIAGAHIPLQIKSSEKLLNEHYNTKGHKKNTVGIYTADKSIISGLEPELRASIRSFANTPFTMPDGSAFNPFNTRHTEQLKLDLSLQQKFLDHFVETTAPKYRGHQNNIGSYTGFDLMVY